MVRNDQHFLAKSYHTCRDVGKKALLLELVIPCQPESRLYAGKVRFLLILMQDSGYIWSHGKIHFSEKHCFPLSSFPELIMVSQFRWQDYPLPGSPVDRG
jgi:hypothetical protein